MLVGALRCVAGGRHGPQTERFDRSAMSGAGSDFMSAEDDEPVTLEGSPLPLASPRAEVVRMKGAHTT